MAKALTIIRQEYSHKHLCLVWDNATFHKSKKLREELKANLIWEYAKEEISNHQANRRIEIEVLRFYSRFSR